MNTPRVEKEQFTSPVLLQVYFYRYCVFEIGEKHCKAQPIILLLTYITLYVLDGKPRTPVVAVKFFKPKQNNNMTTYYHNHS